MNSDGEHGVHHPYQDVILQHARSPLGYAEDLALAQKVIETNPLCGDEVTVMGRLTPQDRLEIAFHCRACMVCKASASIMVGALSGQTKAQAQAIISKFCQAFSDFEEEVPKLMSDSLEALFDLRRFPTRLKCVLLPWDAATKLLYNQD